MCADSHFASVLTADYARAMVLRFIVVVKTAVRRYPVEALSVVELQNRCDKKVWVRIDE